MNSNGNGKVYQGNKSGYSLNYCKTNRLILIRITEMTLKEVTLKEGTTATNIFMDF
jgi:hypothetical protein